jgi:signal peptidase II
VSSHRSRSGPPAGSPGSPGDPAAGAPARRRTGVLVGTAVLVLALDLVSKVLVVAELMHRPPVKLPGGFLWLVHARNPGAAFSFAEGATVVFTAVAAIVIVVIVRTAAKLRSTAWAISLGLVLGGAAGNLVDRLFRSPAPLRGWVVDWISLRSPDGRMLFPIFNLADSGIVCGGILAVLLALLGVEMDGTRGTRGGRDEPAPVAPPAAAQPPTPPGPADLSPRDPGATGYVPSTGPTAGPATGPTTGPATGPAVPPSAGSTPGPAVPPSAGSATGPAGAAGAASGPAVPPPRGAEPEAWRGWRPAPECGGRGG